MFFGPTYRFRSRPEVVCGSPGGGQGRPGRSKLLKRDQNHPKSDLNLLFVVDVRYVFLALFPDESEFWDRSSQPGHVAL